MPPIVSPARIIAALGLAAVATFAATLAMPVRSAPEARFTTLSGEHFVTSDLRGKVAIVNFWATNCPSCIAEMPALAGIHDKFAPRGLEMIAVALHHDDRQRVAEFAQRHALPFKVAHDAGKRIAAPFGNVHITPTTFIVDKRGRLIRRYQGQPDWKEFEAVVERALAERI
jgi:peroxiredoxin